LQISNCYFSVSLGWETWKKNLMMLCMVIFLSPLYFVLPKTSTFVAFSLMMFMFELSNWRTMCFPCLATSWKNYTKKKEAALKKKKTETLQGIKIIIFPTLLKSIVRWH
jgi:hypothetical protein